MLVTAPLILSRPFEAPAVRGEAIGLAVELATQ
jgi:hypothetical protein